MPSKVPTYVAQDVDQARPGSLPAAPTIDMSGLARGLTSLGQSMASVKLQAKEQLEKKQKASNDLWVSQQIMRAQKETLSYLAESSMNPQTSAVEDFDKFFQDSSEVWTKEAPSAEASQALQERLNSLYGSEHVVGTVLNNRVKANFIAENARLDDMEGFARDMASMIPNEDILEANLLTIDNALKAAVEKGLLGAETAEARRAKFNSLRLEAVDLWTERGEIEAASALLSNIKGISGNTRAQYEQRIKNAEKTNNLVDTTILDREADGYFALLERKGSGAINKQLRNDIIAAADEKKQEAVAKIFDLRVDVAIGSYNFTQGLKGLSGSEAIALAEKYNPAPGKEIPKEIPDTLEWQLYDRVLKSAQNYQELIDRNPHEAAMLALSDDMKEVRAMPQTNEAEATAKTEAFENIIAASVAMQKSWGLRDDQIRYMPDDEIKDFRGLLSTGSAQSIIDGVNSIKSLYGEYSPDVIRDIQAMPNNDGVSKSLLGILDVIDGANTPPWVNDFIVAQKQEIKDIKGLNEATETLDKKRSSSKGTIGRYLQALGNTGSEEAYNDGNDIIVGIAKYHTFLKTKGIDNLDEAAKMVVNAQVVLGRARDRDFAIPRSTTISGNPISDNDMRVIETSLNTALDLPNYSETTFDQLLAHGEYAQRGAIMGAPVSRLTQRVLGLVGSLATAEGAKANNMLFIRGKEDWFDTLRSKAYWAHKEGTNEMVLMASISDMFAAPVAKGFKHNPDGSILKDENGLPQREFFTVSLDDVYNAHLDLTSRVKRHAANTASPFTNRGLNVR